ncbi:hypothetical protein PP504_gp58 [Gordonia phage Dolores]|uniref:Uncharacterized protein n=3 Tax=Caudoviricetes TaxID=2731619 RepID=A0A0U4IHX5_9CAUD|nr:hypothetical protein PP503_gp58 [Gordonia phage Sekhmet]YP_010654225.1 hypothetical protein PP504_gp58 [Gordonia phage Dolores]YP_010654922.1 hypothetical protein PP513_gp61 [Gordonia phage Howe]AZF93246.1 hypothetical protein SEA_ADORA_58 [Gordonia phage Adora]QDF16841.1 hypothetical protein SEA_TWINKLE_60 [Gordonia phage Twinkle]QYC54460.1 hypothetical protein SEA_SHLIM410_59 [Gordonia phage Shlim410]UAJ16310.1 hypothetical protein SEA_HORTENSE_61 [Gordonia phage Hortense]URM87955.1 hyp
MTGNRYQVRAIHYSDGTVDDLDAMRKMNDEAVSLSYWLANELGEHVDHQENETLVDTVKRYALQDHNDLSQLLLEAADVLSAGLPPGTKVGGRGVADAARRLVDERDAWRAALPEVVERIKAGKLAWDGTAWTTPGGTTDLVDHHDPEQVRRAAGILEGIGMDAGVTRPELHMETATSLRERAARLEASQPSRETVVEKAARALFDATADKPEAYDHVRHHWIRYAQALDDAKLLAAET